MKIVCLHIILFSFFLTLVFGQEKQWELNPKVLNDTIDVHMYTRDPDVYIEGNYDIIADNQDYFWVSTFENGLLRLDINYPITFKQNQPEGYGFDQLSPHNLYYYEDSLYITSERGFLVYNENTQTFKRYGKEEIATRSAYKAGVHCMAFISRDTVLLGTKWGLTLFDKKNDKVIKNLWEEDPPKDGHSTYNFVSQLRLDKTDANVIWGVGRKGLFSLDKRDWKRTYYPYPDKIPVGSQRDYMTDFVQSNGSLYVKYFGGLTSRTRGGELLKFEMGTKKWKQVIKLSFHDKYGEKFVSEIQTLKEYGDYVFLVSRAFGVQLINSKNDEIIQFYGAHPYFKRPNLWTNPKRNLDKYLTGMYCGLIDNRGYLWGTWSRDNIIRSKEPLFFPKHAIEEKSLQISNLKVNDIKYRMHILRDSIVKNKILLKSFERHIDFDFGLVNAVKDSLRYEYKFDSKNWIVAKNGNVRIDQIHPGNNKLFLRALHRDKVINSREINFYSTHKIHEWWWFKVGVLLLVGSIIFMFYKIKINSIRKEEKLKSQFQKQISEIEMQALRAQMNPHFLFNSLNSIKHYAVNKTKKETAEYITTFSQLIRQILQNSNDKIVSLTQELKAIQLYVAVEQNRFDQKFDFKLDLDDEINTDTIFVPPMLLQPYIENAIWHGLMHKKSKGVLELTIKDRDQSLHCTIEDDGIGRVEAEKIKIEKLKFKKKSLGTQITSDRIELIQKIYKVRASVDIIDLKDAEGSPSGTKVIIQLPKILKDHIHSLRNNPPT